MEKGKVKVGVRATDFDTTIITKHFGGGGHRLASGCKFDSLQEFLDKLYNPLIKGELKITYEEVTESSTKDEED
jgi:hypothetical protein